MKRNMSKYLFCCAFLLGLLWSTEQVSAQQNSYPKVVRNGVEYYQYNVSAGEGIYAICRRFRVTQEVLLQLNPDIQHGVKLGQVLIIPVSVGDTADSPYEESNFFYHTVNQGETLYSIARSYGVKIADIAHLNPKQTDGLKVGLMLKIPQVNELPAGQFHTVAPKETLYAVAKRYGTTMQELVSLNPGLTAHTFSVGKVIMVPSTKQVDTVVESTLIDTATSQLVSTDTIYVVGRRETLFGISKKFNKDMAELIRLNPVLRRGVKEGIRLRIPIDQPVVAPTPVQPQVVEQVAENDAIDIANILKESTKAKPQRMINVALLLPFMIGESDNNDSFRFIEYYEGFLLAVEQLKREGVSVRLNVYDTGGGMAKVKTILSNPEMEEVDLIVGPMYNDQIALVADFSKRNKKMMVIPFTSKNDEILTNPYLYQINTPQSYLYSEVAQAFCKRFKQYNILFLEDPLIKNDKEEFVSALKSEMNRVGLKFDTYSTSVDTIPHIKDHLHADKRNLVVPTNGSTAFLEKYLPALRILGEQQTEFEINLFGYPEWQVYTRDYIEAFYMLNTTIYSSFFINAKDADFRQMYRNFLTTYTKDLRNTYPKYGVLGYDSGLYFLQGINKWGENFILNSQKFKRNGIQTGFAFERVNNWGGYINKKVFFVTYQKDYRIEKSDVQ